METINFLLSNFVDAIEEFLGSVIDWMMDVIIDIIELGEKVALGNELSFVNDAFLLMQGIGTVLLCCMVGKQVIATYITETDGDPDTEPTQLLVKFSIAMAYVWASGAAIKILIGWSGTLRGEILGTAPVEIKRSLSGALAAASSLNGGIGTFILLVYVIGVLIFAFKAAIRGAELVLMKILLPIFACDIVTPSRERWNAFSFTILITIFGYVFQLFLFRISLIVIMKGLNPIYAFSAGSFLYLAIKTPEWLNKFCYSSGLGQMAGRGASSAPYLLMSVMRRG